LECRAQDILPRMLRLHRVIMGNHFLMSISRQPLPGMVNQVLHLIQEEILNPRKFLLQILLCSLRQTSLCWSTRLHLRILNHQCRRCLMALCRSLLLFRQRLLRQG
jgi:hypothetical protein